MEQANNDNHSPIIEALAEIRFDLNVPVSVLLGKIYDGLVALYPDFQQLPVSAIPEGPLKDLNLQDSPHYRFINNDHLVNVGPTLITINQVCTTQSYAGWSALRERINQVANILKESNTVQEAKLLRVRYINFFQVPNFKTIINARAEVANCTLADAETFSVNLACVRDGIKDKVGISSDAQAIYPEQIRKGQLIDLECSLEAKTPIDEWTGNLDKVHDRVLDLFFGTMSKSYISETKLTK
jgi:uncharacterized protein (TIGR04255 family)